MRRKGAGHRRERRARSAAPEAEGKALTANQARFCEEYFIHLNAAKAYRDAYPEAKASTAETSGTRLLRNVRVKARLAELLAARSARTQVTADQVLQELKRLAFSDIRELVEWGEHRTERQTVTKILNGVAQEVEEDVPVGGFRFRASSELSADAAACVSEVSETHGMFGPTLKLKLHDKKGALELLARHLGMLKDAAPSGPFIVQFVREGSR